MLKLIRISKIMAQDPNQAPSLELLAPEVAEAYLLSVSAVLGDEHDPIEVEGLSVDKQAVTEGQDVRHSYLRWDTEVSIETAGGDQLRLSETDVVQDWDGAKTLKLTVSKSGSQTAHLVKRHQEATKYWVTGMPPNETADKGEGEVLFAMNTKDFKAALDEKLAGRPDLLARIDQAADARLAEQAPSRLSRAGKALGSLITRKRGA